MTMSVSRARSSFPDWKMSKNAWETKNKIKKHWKKPGNPMTKQKYKLA